MNSLFKNIDVFAKFVKQAEVNSDELQTKLFLDLEVKLNEAFKEKNFFKFAKLLAEFCKNEMQDPFINGVEAIRTLQYWEWTDTQFTKESIPIDAWIDFTKGWNAGYKSSEKITNKDIAFTKELVLRLKQIHSGYLASNNNSLDN